MGKVVFIRKFLKNATRVSKKLQEFINHHRDQKKLNPSLVAPIVEELQQQMDEFLVISPIEENHPLVLFTDASDHGIAGYLTQEIDGTMFINATFSRTLKNFEKGYHTNKKAIAAIVHSVTYLKDILRHRKFTIMTDNTATAAVLNFKNAFRRPFERWQMARYDYDIKHIPGSANTLADLWSRTPARVLNISVAEKKDEQPLLKWLRDLHYSSHQDHQALYKAALDEFGEHPQLSALCQRVTDECLVCLMQNRHKSSYRPLGHASANHPFESVQIDLFGPINNRNLNTKKKFTYALVYIDVFTSFCIIRPLVNKTGEEVVAQLRPIFATFGVPKILASDGGSEFTNETLTHMIQAVQTIKRTAAAYNPRSTGKVERHIRSIKQLMYKLLSEGEVGRDWSTVLEVVQYTLNTRKSNKDGKLELEIRVFGDKDPDWQILDDELVEAYFKAKKKFEAKNFTADDFVYDIKRYKLRKTDLLLNNPQAVIQQKNQSKREVPLDEPLTIDDSPHG